MTAPLILAVVVLYTNGAPVGMEVLGGDETIEHCTAAAKQELTKIQSEIPVGMQAVVKCIDYSAAPFAVSVFGTKK